MTFLSNVIFLSFWELKWKPASPPSRRRNSMNSSNACRMKHPNSPSRRLGLAQFVSLNISSLGLETGKSLAEKAGVSEVTVGRLLRRLGCDGMKGLKQLLREHYSVTTASFVTDGDIPLRFVETLEAEVQGLTNVFNQTQGDNWEEVIRLVSTSETIYATGFQSIRGTVEDFARRMALARKNVHFLSAP